MQKRGMWCMIRASRQHRCCCRTMVVCRETQHSTVPQTERATYTHPHAIHDTELGCLLSYRSPKETIGLYSHRLQFVALATRCEARARFGSRLGKNAHECRPGCVRDDASEDLADRRGGIWRIEPGEPVMTS
jgi:hypothetical protein